ncbi:MAG TPA: RNA-guided endonuclease IscB [Ktedonobacterales bacterium]|jgi:5-methylcytosine-specific restriction endonuclease McrA
MSKVFVVDSEKRPLDPVHPGYARWLLSKKHAAVFRRYPFTLILREKQPEVPTEPLRLKIDPGSKTTGLAVVNDATGQVVWAAELLHRGQAIKKALANRRMVRRSRRARKTRYREARFSNRRKPEGWLPPSLESRVHNLVTWVSRLRRLCPIEALSVELVRFDTQLMEHPEISGIEYQQGTLVGYEVREYLLEKWGRTCAYCGKTAVPLEVEHIVPRARGGSHRISNLALACEPCNTKKGTQTAAEFGHPEVQSQAKRPLKDAAAVNVTRWALFRRLQATGLPVEGGTGGRTKWNRTTRQLPKTHWLDAACVGASTPEVLQVRGVVSLVITATGWQSRQMCLMDKPGFPRTRAKQQSRVRGFRTGDIVRAVVTTGTKVGTYVGRVAVRTRGAFNVTTRTIKVEDISHRYCRLLQQADGYSYEKGERGFLSLP